MKISRIFAIASALSLAIGSVHGVYCQEEDPSQVVETEPADSGSFAPDASQDLFSSETASLYKEFNGNRTLVSATSSYPYLAIARLDITYDGLECLGTGFLISDDTILTAGHCIYSDETDSSGNSYGFAQSIIVEPGWNGSSSAYATYSIRQCAADGWVSSFNRSYDYGFIKLNEPIGYKTGTLALNSSFEDTSATVEIAGYPGIVSGTSTTKMWSAKGTISSFDSALCYYTIDTSEGQSGSPVFTNDNKVVAIHIAHADDANVGRRIASDLTSVLDSYQTSHVSVWKLYNPNSGEHFYTTSSKEYYALKALGWRGEGNAWYGQESGTAVYRLYNPNSGDHHYTTSENEKNTLVKLGWNYEGVAFMVPASSTSRPVYRLYNPNAKTGAHHFTKDSNEVSTLESLGWKYEGIAWYSN